MTLDDQSSCKADKTSILVTHTEPGGRHGQPQLYNMPPGCSLCAQSGMAYGEQKMLVEIAFSPKHQAVGTHHDPHPVMLALELQGIPQ